MLKFVLGVLLIVGVACSVLTEVQQHQQTSFIRHFRKRRDAKDNFDLEAILKKEPRLRSLYDRAEDDRNQLLLDIARYASLTPEEQEEFFKNDCVFKEKNEKWKKSLKQASNTARFLGKLSGIVSLAGIISGKLTNDQISI